MQTPVSHILVALDGKLEFFKSTTPGFKAEKGTPAKKRAAEPQPAPFLKEKTQDFFQRYRAFRKAQKK